MDELDREALLARLGLRSEALGPPEEWLPVTPDQYQRRHQSWWAFVLGVLEDEPGEYEDLPHWMTEQGSEALLANDN